MSDNNNTGSFTKQASKVSWLSSLLALGVMVFGKSAMESLLGGIIVGGVAILLFVTGIVFGIIGLSSIKQYGKKAIMTPSIVGLILNVGFLSLFLFIGYSGYQSYLEKKGYTQLKNKINEINKRARAEAIEGGKVSDETIEQYSNMNDEFNKIIETKKGEEKKALQVMVKIRDMIQENFLDYIGKAKALDENDIWNFVALKEEGDYASRYQLIQDAHTASERCLEFMENIGVHVDKVLEQENIRNDLRAKVKRTFLDSLGNKSTRLYEINCDQLMVMLIMFKFLEENQEEWDIDNGQLVFFNKTLLNRYNVYFEQISSMDNEKIEVLKNNLKK